MTNPTSYTDEQVHEASARALATGYAHTADILESLAQERLRLIERINGILTKQAKVHVGESHFETWFADEFTAAGKGVKQQMREAYETGMNDLAAHLSQVAQACTECEPDGVFDTNGNGPFDCYACGKKAQGAQVSISDALNRLEAMARAGEQLHGDDVHRFLATADKIAPQGAQGESVASIQVPREGLPRQAQFIPHPAWMHLSPGIHDLYTHPAERAAVPNGLVLVTKEDGSNYCRILTLLGMEEEGDAVEAIEKLLAATQPHEGARVVGGEETLRVSRRDLLTLLDHNLDAANEAIQSTSGIDFIEAHGGPDSEEIIERVAYHLYYGLFAAERLRAQLTAPTLAGKEGAS